MLLKDAFRLIEDLAPLSYAAPWDNCGLQVGDPDAPLRGIVVAVNASEAAIAQARSMGANLLVTHHPLLFKPTKMLDARTEPGRTVLSLAETGLSLYAAHTNLDATACNHHLAAILGLPLDRPLEVYGRHPWFKLVVWTPPLSVETVREALWSAGAGCSENYDQSSFHSEGRFGFRPLPGTEPSVGVVGERHESTEVRLEVLVPERRIEAAIAAMVEAHPYQEPAYDLIRLENAGSPYGIGLWGELDRPLTVADIAERIREVLKPRSLRLVGSKRRKVNRVGICSGSGGDLLDKARKNRLDLFITGELRYHTALDALGMGIDILEAGHQATEEPVVGYLVDYLRARIPEAIPIAGVAEPEPFEVIA